MKKLISLLLLIFTFVLLLSITTTATDTNVEENPTPPADWGDIIDSGSCGENLTYTLDSDGLLTVSGTGDMYEWSYGEAPWYSNRNSIEKVVINTGVTSIGAYAFYHCESLTSITISDSVTSIGRYAFCWCTGLTSATIPDGVTSIESDAFYWCTGLTSITIPNSVTSIGDYAFYNCYNLTTITIPHSVTKMGINPFARCTNLTKISVDENNENYLIDEQGVFYNKEKTELIVYPAKISVGNYIVPDGVTKIGEYAFYQVYGLTSITIPDSVTSIGAYAFQFCGNLAKILVDENNEKYSSDEQGVFYNKEKTELIVYPAKISVDAYTIPDSVTSIGNNAFTNCYNLTSITIPDSVTKIGSFAFSGCINLTTILVDENNEKYSSDDQGVLYNKEKTELIRCPAKSSVDIYTIPDSVTSIGSSAFDNCTSLTSITIPNSVKIIGNSAFKNCRSLTSITIPNSVTEIGTDAFIYCTNLTSATILNRATKIGNFAFNWCANLTIYGYSNSNAQTYATNNNIPFVVLADKYATFTISDGKAKPGETIKLTLSLKTNTPINSIAISKLSYDEDVLEFVGFADYEGIADIAALTPVFDNDKKYLLIALAEDTVFDADICTLEFKVKESATDTVTSISATPLVKLNSELIPSSVDEVEFTVYTYVVGDIDGDEDVDLDDAVYLFGYSMLPDIYPTEYPATMDFTGDGAVDLQDAKALFRYSMLPDIYPLFK